MTYDAGLKKTWPVKIYWNGREYRVEKVGLVHKFREGRVLMHVFSVVAGETFFRLAFNSENLTWRLTEVADGLAD